MIKLLLIERLGSGTSPEDGTSWLTFQCDKGKVLFWGSPDISYVNIRMLENQSLPVLVELTEPELCTPTMATKSLYDCDFSVNEECCVIIYPTLEPN